MDENGTVTTFTTAKFMFYVFCLTKMVNEFVKCRKRNLQ